MLSGKFWQTFLQIRLATRGKILDGYVKDFLHEYPRGTVIELGSGLSTRMRRVDNGEVIWYCVDLPEAMAFREKLIGKRERCENIACSMFNTDWIQKVLREEGPWMLVVEGVLPYF